MRSPAVAWTPNHDGHLRNRGLGLGLGRAQWGTPCEGEGRGGRDASTNQAVPRTSAEPAGAGREAPSGRPEGSERTPTWTPASCSLSGTQVVGPAPASPADKQVELRAALPHTRGSWCSSEPRRGRLCTPAPPPLQCPLHSEGESTTAARQNQGLHGQWGGGESSPSPAVHEERRQNVNKGPLPSFPTEGVCIPTEDHPISF